MNINLLIYPGGGNPQHHKYKSVYQNIINEAKRRGFNECKIVTWPGHFSHTNSETLTLSKAVDCSIQYLKDMDLQGINYRIIARSFGCNVIMRTLELYDVKKLIKIFLWGPSPYHCLYEMFVKNFKTSYEAGISKEVSIDKNFFKDYIPFEVLLKNYNKNIPVLIATGSLDTYSTPYYLNYLENLNIKIYINFKIIENLPHEVQTKNNEYFNMLFY